MLLRKLYLCSIEVKLILLKTFTVASIHKLKVAENRVPNSQAVIRNLVFKFMLRLSDNKLVIVNVCSDLKWQSRIRRDCIKMYTIVLTEPTYDRLYCAVQYFYFIYFLPNLYVLS